MRILSGSLLTIVVVVFSACGVNDAGPSATTKNETPADASHVSSPTFTAAPADHDHSHTGDHGQSAHDDHQNTAHGHSTHGDANADHHGQAHGPHAAPHAHSTDRSKPHREHAATDASHGQSRHGRGHGDDHGALAPSDQHAPHDHGHGQAASHDASPTKAITADHSDDAQLSALELFKRRIVPIMKADNPSSCIECHLSGVDLKQYIHASQEKTFANLRDDGLIDTANPDNSKILKFISRSTDETSLITEKVRQEEYAAFRAWIHAAVKDSQLAAAKTDDDALGPSLPLEVIRHARRDRVLASFIDNVWSEVGRCAACHSPDRNQKQVKEHGEQVSWIKLRDPAGTLQYMLEAELIDVANPEDSLLLSKPTLQVEHAGGKKMEVGDRTYKQFRRFIEDYAASAAGRYTSTDDLPQPNAEVSEVSDIWLKVEGVPAQYDKMVMQVDLHRWDEHERRWADERWATGDRAIFGKGQLWQNHLSITAPRGSERAQLIRRAASLPRGMYLAKIYIDKQGKLQDQYTYELGENEFVGQVEIQSQWPAGYGRMTAVRFPRE